MNQKYLYRYRSMLYKDLDRTFTHNELYYASPDSFNDPFDCKTPFTLKNCKEGDLKTLRELMAKWLENDSPHLSKGQRETRLDEHFKKDVILTALKETLQKNNSPLGMLCLSAVCDNILMWSHYANGHRGIALQFDKNGFMKWAGYCHAVNYQKKYPTLKDWLSCTTTNNYDELARNFLLRKSADWRYEKEFRAIQDPNLRDNANAGSRIYHFPKELLTGVILGAQISDHDRFRVEMWCHNCLLVSSH